MPGRSHAPRLLRSQMFRNYRWMFQKIYSHIFSWRTKLAKLLCLKYFGSISRAKVAWSCTRNPVPFCEVTIRIPKNHFTLRVNINVSYYTVNVNTKDRPKKPHKLDMTCNASNKWSLFSKSLALFHEMCSSYCGSSTSFQSFTRKAGTLEWILLESASPVLIGMLC